MFIDVDREEKQARACRSDLHIPVELAGIEPDTEFVLSCGNIGFRNAKARETTRRDLLIHRRVLMASTAPSRPFERGQIGAQASQGVRPRASGWSAMGEMDVPIHGPRCFSQTP
jgi:hypothetical protein